MLSEDLFSLRRFLEDKLNTYSRIDLTTVDSIGVIERMQEFEERIIALENGVVKESVKADLPKPAKNVIILDFHRIKRG